MAETIPLQKEITIKGRFAQEPREALDLGDYQEFELLLRARNIEGDGRLLIKLYDASINCYDSYFTTELSGLRPDGDFSVSKAVQSRSARVKRFSRFVRHEAICMRPSRSKKGKRKGKELVESSDSVVTYELLIVPKGRR